MLEAVNSVLQTAPQLRGNTEQMSTVDSYAANPARVQKIPQAPYISPYIHMDVNLDMAVLQIRDSETGDVVRQIPSETTVEARQRFQSQIALEQLQAQGAARRRPAQDDAQAAAAGTGNARQAPQAEAQAQQARHPAPQARQLAAFQTAAVSGNVGAQSGSSVTLFA